MSSDEEKSIFTDLKHDIYKILNLNNLDSAKTFRNELINKKYPKNKFINKITWKFIIPTLKNYSILRNVYPKKFHHPIFIV